MTAEAIATFLLETEEDEFDIKRFILKRPQPSEIKIIGKRWFRRGPGTTYHSAHIYIDGRLVHVTPREYGYGDQYLDTGLRWLVDNGYIQKPPPNTPPWAWLREQNIPLVYYAQDVPRQRDLQ